MLEALRSTVQTTSTNMPAMLRLPGLAKKVAEQLLGKPFAGSKKSKASKETDRIINQQYTTRIR